MGKDLQFHELPKEDVVVGQQQAIAVWPGQNGEVFICQERDPFEERDTIILVRAENAERLAMAILDAAKVARTGA